MKIVYLITGSGGSFYCGNCYRDMIYLRAIRKSEGINATAIPLYLPPDKTNSETGLDKNVFFGAISMYMREKVPGFKKMPAFLEKLFDSGPLLRIAASKAGTTRTEGLEEMTLNMIRGGNTFPEKEIDRLIDHMLKEGKPDIIHLSNALVIGIARQLKKKLDVKIVCSLLNEDDWIDEMAEPYQSSAWDLIGKEAENVDAFITPSSYYKDLFISKTGISGDNFHIIPLSVESGGISFVKKEPVWPSLGYLCRLNSQNGFDKLVDAFIRIKMEDLIPGLTLHVSGGYTGDDKPFVATQIKKLKENNLEKDVTIQPEFQGISKEEFFKSINVMSVPVRKYDGYGLYLIEANEAGIPVVQPSTGAFPEIIEMTSGGITYSPDTVEYLVKSLVSLFNSKELVNQLGESGRESVHSKLSLDKMSARLSLVYNALNVK